MMDISIVTSGAFPPYILPPSEPLWSDVPDMLTCTASDPWYITDMMVGVACTVWNDWRTGRPLQAARGGMVEKLDDHGMPSPLWELVNEFAMVGLPTYTALQFAACGPGITGNPHGLDEVTALAFTAWDFREMRRLSLDDLVRLSLAVAVGLPDIDRGAEPLDEAWLIDRASRSPAGIVVRAQDSLWSFRVPNPNQ